MVGLQIYGARPGGFLAAIGLEHGDVVRKVNEFELASTFKVSVLRGGHPVMLTVTLHSRGPEGSRP
jgi:hypothetical protein